MSPRALSLSFLLFVDGLCAQPSYEKFYVSAAGAYQGNLIELNAQKLLYAGALYPGISLLDPGGNVIASTCYASDSVTTMASIRRYGSDQFLFATGYDGDSCTTVGPYTIPYVHPAIGKMDSVGNVLLLYRYPLNSVRCGNIPGDLLVTGNQGAIAWGSKFNFFALRVDSFLAPVWARSFSNHGGFQFIKELPGGDLLAGINMDTAGAVVARMDASGNFLWCKSYMRPRGMVHDAIIESDSTFIITGFTDSTASTNPFTPLPPTFHPKLFMMKLDGAGDVQWCKGYDSDPYRWYTPQWSRIERTLGGQYVLLATLGQPGFNFFYRPCLMKTDQNGDTLWTRSVGKNNFDHYTRDLLAHSDGGFVFSGIIWGNLPGNNSGLPYIFKTDSLGHFSCYERWHQVVVSDLFPVDSSFTLTSIDGATMYPAFVNDTVFDPIVVYDGCTFTTGFDPWKARKFKVRPNPNTGHFTVEFGDPLMAQSYYSVYDSMGRLLYQRPLPTGATMEEVDLSRYGKGAYVIKLTDKEGVRYERVVLE